MVSKGSPETESRTCSLSAPDAAVEELQGEGEGRGKRSCLYVEAVRRPLSRQLFRWDHRDTSMVEPFSGAAFLLLRVRRRHGQSSGCRTQRPINQSAARTGTIRSE